MKGRSYVLSLLVTLFVLCTIHSIAQVEWVDYPYPLKDEFKRRIRFGYLTVPETRDTSKERKIRMAFCVLKSSSERPLKDAIIYIPGGPGGGYTGAVTHYLSLPSINYLLEQRDIVLIDPRGCGQSEPRICEALNDLEIANANFAGVSNQAYLEKLAKTMMECARSITEREINLHSYGSTDVAKDVDDLRIALGYEKWNIYAKSYGTRYAQAFIWMFPHSTRSVVLSGVVPAALTDDNHEFFGLVHSLQLVFDRCKGDPECHHDFPDLESDLLSILTRTETEPIILPAGSTHILTKSPLVITPRIALDGIAQALYDREGIEMTPLLIHTLAQGNDWIAKPIALSMGAEYSISSRDIFYAVRCNDNPGVHFSDPPFQSNLAKLLYPYWIGNKTMTEVELCGNLGLALDSLEQIPVRSRISALIYTGEFDPVTPTYNTDSVAKYMSNAISFVVPGRGHDATASVEQLVADFFVHPDEKPDLSVLRHEKPIKFLTGVSLNKGISALTVRMATGKYLEPIIFMATFVILSLTGLIFFPARHLTMKLTKREITVSAFQWLPIWSVSVLSFLFLLLLCLAFMNAIGTNPSLVAFGLSRQWSSIFYLPWVVMLMLILSAAVSRPVWKSTGRVVKLLWVATWLGGLGLIVFLWQYSIL